MLDTNIVSALVNNPDGGLARRLRALAAPASISIIVAGELRYGAAKRGSARLAAAIEQVLAVIETEPLCAPVDTVYAALRASLERLGARMGANDLLIATHALTLERVLVTRGGPFARVPGLAVEDWPG